MDPKQQALRNLQKDRQQRGDDFQAEIRRSWRQLPNIWRFRIPDGGGGTRPADEIILAQDLNILAEHKRTKKKSFQLDFLRPNQVQGLLDFERVIDRNYGLVFVSFLDDKAGVDEAYAFRLVQAMQFMKKKGRVSITLDEFRRQAMPCISLPLLPTAERTYDLQGVLTCYKSI